MIPSNTNAYHWVLDSFKNVYDSFHHIRQSNLVQDIMSVSQLIFGGFALSSIAEECRPPKQVFTSYKIKTSNKEKFLKTIAFLGNLSFVGTALTCRPMVFVWRWSARQILSESSLDHYFGPAALLSSQRLFNVISFSSFILSLPSTCKVAYDTFFWIKRKMSTKTHKRYRSNAFATINTRHTSKRNIE